MGSWWCTTRPTTATTPASPTNGNEWLHKLTTHPKIKSMMKWCESTLAVFGKIHEHYGSPCKLLLNQILSYLIWPYMTNLASPTLTLPGLHYLAFWGQPFPFLNKVTFCQIIDIKIYQNLMKNTSGPLKLTCDDDINYTIFLSFVHSCFSLFTSLFPGRWSSSNEQTSKRLRIKTSKKLTLKTFLIFKKDSLMFMEKFQIWFLSLLFKVNLQKNN